MAAGDRYRGKALELLVLADSESIQTVKAEFENLALPLCVSPNKLSATRH